MGDLSGQLIKGYELKERIGAGGFGAVYKAYQSTVGREVAIKFILPHFANQPDFIRRFETEAQLVARLEHLHIVPLYDYWRDPEGAYLVMRWMRGGSLRELLQKDGACDLEQTGQILEQITSALAVAHRNNIIHRDIKPGNILLDEDGNAYLADFGIAKDISQPSENATSPDAIVGSPDYLSPEQARSEGVIPATDVYSLGVVLYEMLTGEHPFRTGSTVERLYKHLNEPLPAILTLDVSLSDAVNGVIQKATAKNPKERYPDTLSLGRAFREAAALGQLNSSDSIVEMLTRKEQEILHHIAEGRTNKEIAGQLYVTVATVKWYITQIYRKLHVRSRMQAIVRARELNLVVGTDATMDGPTLSSEAVLIPTDQFQPDNPYKGLRPFEAADFREFFGRERLINKLIQRLCEPGNLTRFLAVVGPSGSGKSSLVKAGLIPAIWRGELEGSEKWFVVEMVPGPRPLDELDVALTRIASTQTTNLYEQLQRDEYGLVRATALVLPDDGSELLLVIDQFEEVFTLMDDEAARQHFLKLIHAAVTERRSRIRVVITLRADFYDRPLHYPDFGELVRNRMETVLPLGAKELEAVIVDPAKGVGVTFENGLVGTIIDDIHYQAGALPLLQYGLTELFERREGRVLSQAAYEDMGRATGALANRAEELFREFDENGQDHIRQMFLRLVTLADGIDDTRRRTARSELLSLSPESDLLDDIIDTFVEHRLLSLDNDPATRRPTVEVAHEALLREWQRLSNWLIESRDDIRSQQQITHLALEWYGANHDRSFMLRGARLQQFEVWSKQTELILTPDEQAYLTACIANRDQEQAVEQAQQAHVVKLEKRSRNFLRGLVAVMAMATIIAFSLARVAQRNEADAERSEAVAERNAQISQSLALASAAQAALSDGDVEQSLALAVAANQIAEPPIFAQRTLYEIAFTPATQAVVSGGDGWRWFAEISPNGQMIAVDEDNVRYAIWDIHRKEVLIRLDGNHPDGISGAAFTPDSQHLLVGAWDDSLELWDINTGEIIWSATNPAGDPNSVVISPDGTLAIVGSELGVATLWDVQTGEFIDELVGHNPTLQVQGTAFSPDGRLAATASEDDTAIIWNVENREVLHRLEGHRGIVFSVSFSPDGRTLASTSFDNTIILWDVETGQMLRQLIGHSDYVFDVDWSFDGSSLLSASRDSTLILWDAADGTRLHSYRDEAGRSLTVSFIDDRHALSAGSSGNVRFWSLYDEREQQRFDLSGEPIYSMSITHDERMAAIGTQNAAVLISLSTGDDVRRFRYDGGAVTSVVFSPDENTLISGFEDNTTIMWDIQTGEEIRRLEGHSSLTTSAANEEIVFGRILDLAVSPDGQRVLSAAEDRTMIVWDANTGEIVHQFESCSDTINTVAFSPDGRFFVGGFGTISDPTRGSCPETDFTIHLWDTDTGELVRQFVGHEGAVVQVQFSPNGRWLVSGSLDETVRLWDVQTGAEIRRFDGHTGGVLSVDFSGDGRYIVSGASDGTVKVWDSETGDLLRQMGEHSGQVKHVQFSADSSGIWSSSADGTVRLWMPMLDRQELLLWVSQNRYVRELTCSEQALYLLVDDCE